MGSLRRRGGGGGDGGSSGGGSSPQGAIGLRVLRLGQNKIGTAGAESLLDAVDRRARTRTLWRGRGCISWHPPQLLLSIEQQKETAVAGSAPGGGALRIGAAGGVSTSGGASVSCGASVSATTPTTATIVPQRCIMGNHFYHEHDCDECVEVPPARPILAQTQRVHMEGSATEGHGEDASENADAVKPPPPKRTPPRPRGAPELKPKPVPAAVSAMAPQRRASYMNRHSKLEEKKVKLQQCSLELLKVT